MTEEELQLALQPLYRSIVFGEDYDAPTVEEMVYTAVISYVMTGVVEGDEIAKYARNRPAQSVEWDFADAEVDLDGNMFYDGNTSGNPSDSQNKQGRPSWKQSELDAALNYPSYASQQSFLEGTPVPYGTKGSVRPDYYVAGHSVEIKNYNLETASGRRNLSNNIYRQYIRRMEHLPMDTAQSVMIDIRGQSIADDILDELYNDLMRKTDNHIEILFKMK